jgi:hypothetical protein
VQKAQNKPQCRKLDLKSFLIKPVQRICQYPLLLQELLKHTPDAHQDRANVELYVTGSIARMHAARMHMASQHADHLTHADQYQ